MRDSVLRSDSRLNVGDYEVAIRGLESHSRPIRSLTEVLTVLPGIEPKISKKLEEIANIVSLCEIELIAGNLWTVGR